jgi:hypothetical protein
MNVNLGVTISKDLRWDTHINRVTSKANKTLGFIRWNMRGCTTSARAAAYQGLVWPHLEYACSAWDSWANNNTQQIEKVQRRAAHSVTRNYHDWHPGSVTKMIQDLSWEHLQIRWLKITLVLLYKIQRSLVAIPAELHLTSSDRRTRDIHTSRLPHTRIDTHTHFFYPRTIGDWNKLPSDVVQLNSLESSKVSWTLTPGASSGWPVKPPKMCLFLSSV